MARTVAFDQVPVGTTFLTKGAITYTKVGVDSVRVQDFALGYEATGDARPYRAFVYQLPDDEA